VGPTSLAVDGSGNVILGGQFSGNVAFGATSLASAGLVDGWVAKLSPALAPLWAVRLGGPGNDTVNGLSVDSSGEVIAVGAMNKTVTGAATLAAAGTTASDAFVLQLGGATGATDFAQNYGDASTQAADVVAVNRFGATPNAITLVGTLSGTITFPAPAGSVKATGVTDAFLVTAILK
jgi:hypothetical protein